MSEASEAEVSGVSRRTLMRTAAWAVPVIAVAAPLPAYAASAASDISVTEFCGGTTAPTGRFEITIAPLPSGALIRIALSHSGIGSFSATPDFAFTGSQTELFVVGDGSNFAGSIDVTFTGLVGIPSQAALLVIVTAVSGVTLSGDFSGELRVQRNSETLYLCAEVA